MLKFNRVMHCGYPGAAIVKSTCGQIQDGGQSPKFQSLNRYT